MAQILHPRARSTAAVRLEIQNSKETVASLARRLGLNPKTVAKWKKRTTVTDAATAFNSQAPSNLQTIYFQ